MARYTAEVKYIASIYPGELESIRRHYGPSRESIGKGASRSTLFRLDPVPRGAKPFVLEVQDSFEDIIDVLQMQGKNSENGARPRLQRPVEVEIIVGDLLACWTGGLYNVPAGSTPGVIQIAGSRPTAAELEDMQNRQSLYFEYLFNEGERLSAEKNWKDITGVMRLAAEWLGHQRTWSHRGIASETGPCPLCTQIIPNAAVVCPSCGKVVRAMPPELAALNATAPVLAHK